MGTHLFTYGTLMLPELMRAVSGADFAARPAWLADHARYLLAGQTYPGLVEEPGAQTEGIVYLELTPRALRRLDNFEGGQYLRKTVCVVTPDGAALTAQTYVLHPDARPQLTATPFDLERFRHTDMQRFIADYQGFEKIQPRE